MYLKFEKPNEANSVFQTSAAVIISGFRLKYFRFPTQIKFESTNTSLCYHTELEGARLVRFLTS